MTRLITSVLGVLLFSANAWAIPKDGKRAQVVKANAFAAETCLSLQDPWQDCGEDPWQLTSVPLPLRDDLFFSDPWQDAEDPWQPFPTLVPAGLPPDMGDPWQPLLSQLQPAPMIEVILELSEDPWQPSFEDPWQPSFEDPWQEGADDPWQVR